MISLLKTCLQRQWHHGARERIFRGNSRNVVDGLRRCLMTKEVSVAGFLATHTIGLSVPI